MKVLGLVRLKDFKTKHSDARTWIDCWVSEVKHFEWESPHDIKVRFPSASIIGKNKIIFNIKGNKYRMEIIVSYNQNTLSIKWIGTHADYTKRNKEAKTCK